MRHIKTLARPKQLTSRPSATGSTKSKPTTKTNMVMVKMAAIFGNAWTSQHKDKRLRAITKETWAEEIEKLNDEELTRGMQQVIDSNLQHPPSLSQFVGYCRNSGAGSWEHRGKAYRVFKELPKPPPNKKMAEIEINIMKKTLGSKKAVLPGK